jgi:hypothetical protein
LDEAKLMTLQTRVDQRQERHYSWPLEQVKCQL